ncbi:MAG: hypothetical protein J7L55_03180 [Desulfurococcales archaeon]|nr:hypothetical protein [Desulfurococcales archaeon]
MVTGDLHRYVSGIHDGIPHYSAVMPSTYIGGYGNPNTLTQTLTLDFSVRDALLTILLSGRDLRWRGFMWRVSLGRVTLTREFKPQVIARSNTSSRAAIVFDVSKIVGEAGKYEVKVMCESAEPVRVDSISILGIHPLEGVSSEVGYWVGPLGVEGGEDYSLDLGNEFVGESQLQLTITARSRSSRTEVAVGDFKGDISNILGTDSATLKLQLKSKHSTLKLRHDGPSHIYIDEVIYYKPLSEGPVLELSDITLQGGKVSMTLRNKGSSPAPKALIVGISAGIPVFRGTVGKIEAGASKELVFKASSEVKRPLIIRLIYHGVWGQEVKTYPL